MDTSVAVASLTSFFLSPVLLIMAASIYLILFGIGKYLPKLGTNSTYNRVLPVLPELLGFGATFLSAYKVPFEFSPWVLQHVVVGLWMGMLSSKAFKIVDQTVLGNDDAIKKV